MDLEIVLRTSEELFEQNLSFRLFRVARTELAKKMSRLSLRLGWQEVDMVHRILVADVNRELQKLVRSALEHEDYDVLTDSSPNRGPQSLLASCDHLVGLQGRR
jgi:hypothetical protein